MNDSQETGHEFPWNAPHANAKLASLRKELPWLATLQVGSPNVVKVERFGIDVFSRWVGRVITCDDNYFMFGYAFDEAGTNMGSLHPTRPKARLKQFLMMAKSMLHIGEPILARRDLKDVLREFPNADSIRFVVLFGHDLKHYGDLQLYVYKLPSEKTMSELLNTFDEKGLADEADRLTAASQEVRAELAD